MTNFQSTVDIDLVHHVSPSSITKPFRILSLDGGGIRGAFIASVLATMEERLGPISQHFDLMAGTSTGGIIAAGLATGEPAARIVEFYRVHGSRIFTRPTRTKSRTRKALGWFANRKLKAAGLDDDWLFSPKYDSQSLRSALTSIFLDAKLGSIVRCALVIPSVDLTKGQTVVFKTPHLAHYDRDRHFPIVDVLLATAAAPTYLPTASIGGGKYIDGGVWANNPIIVAIAEAMAILRHRNNATTFECNASELDSIRALSIGTGKLATYLSPPVSEDGLVWWMNEGRLIETMFMAQSQGAGFQAAYLLGDAHSRIDFDIPEKSWKLDNREVIEQLIHIGKEKGKENLLLLDQFGSNCVAD